MGRTLYLNENQGLKVMRDGSSVLILRQERARQRVPARLVSRIVVIGNVQLDAGTITLFTENDIPVVFVGRDAEKVAVALPYDCRSPINCEEQRIFLASEDCRKEFGMWAGTWRMEIQLDLIRHFYRRYIRHEITSVMDEREYQEVLSYLKPGDEEKWEVVSGLVGSLFLSLMIEHLLKAGLNPHIGIMHEMYHLGLAHDLCHVMGAEIDLQCLKFFRSTIYNPPKGLTYKRHLLTEPCIRSIVHRFENSRQELDRLTGNIISDLLELMRKLDTKLRGKKCNEGVISRML